MSETGGHGTTMLSFAATASGHGGFGSEIENRDKERQEEKRKKNSGHRPQTEAISTRGTATTHVKTRHKPIATSQNTLEHGRRRNSCT
jgi:hypothetical protein